MTPEVLPAMLSLRKLRHREHDVLGLFFPYNQDLIIQVKTLPDSKNSASWRMWSGPSTALYRRSIQKLSKTESFSLDHLASLSGTIAASPASDDPTGISSKEELSASASIRARTEAADIQETGKDQLKITFSGNQIFIRLLYDPADVAFLKGLSGSYWNSQYGNWVVRGNEGNFRALQEHFHYWDHDRFLQILDLILRSTDPYVVELFTSPEFPESMLVRVRGFGADVEWIKLIPAREYDQELRRWILPLDQSIVDRLTTHFTQAGAKIINRLPLKDHVVKALSPSLTEKKRHLLNKYPVEQRPLLDDFADTLIRKRYSWNTIKGYVVSFQRYMIFQSPQKIKDAAVEDVQRYLSEMSGRKVSESLLHTVVNAIKFYYEQVYFRPSFKIGQIKRPKKSHTLPHILSIGEVDRLLRALENLKHLAILYALYSSGIRLSELLNLRITDVHWERNQIFIRSGRRVDFNGKINNQAVISIIQKRKEKVAIDESEEDEITFNGGVTLIFDLDSSQLLYAIKKDVRDEARLGKRKSYVKNLISDVDDNPLRMSFDTNSFYGPFASLHNSKH